jgi:hypothetical protein
VAIASLNQRRTDRQYATFAGLEHNPVDLNRKSIGWDSQSLIDRRVSSD